MSQLRRLDACERFRKRASDYLDGHLAEEEYALEWQHEASCSECRIFITSMKNLIRALGKLRISTPTLDSAEPVLEVLGDLTGSVPAAQALGREHGLETLWHELSSAPLSERRTLIEKDPKYHRLRLAAEFMTRAEETSHIDAYMALDYAKTALLVTAQLQRSETSTDMLAACWAAIARARANMSDVAGARKGVEVARQYLEMSSKRPATVTRLLSVEAFVMALVGRSEEAARRYAEIYEIESSLGNRRKAACSKINLGSTHLRTGRLEDAVLELERALALVDSVADPPRIQLAAWFNLAIAFCELEKPVEAEELVPTLAELASKVGGDWPIHLKWLNGSIARTKGESGAALLLLHEVKDIFEKRGEWVHYIECALDIFRVHLGLRDWKTMEVLLTETVTAARKMSAEESSVEAVALLREAVVRESASEAQLQVIARLVWSPVSLRDGSS